MTFYTLINYFRKLIEHFSFTIPHKVVRESLGTHIKGALIQMWKMRYTDTHIKKESCKL